MTKSGMKASEGTSYGLPLLVKSIIVYYLTISSSLVNGFSTREFRLLPFVPAISRRRTPSGVTCCCDGWVQKFTGEWEWEEDDPNYRPIAIEEAPQQDDIIQLAKTSATPQLPSGVYRPKQSLGQNYLKDPNTVGKILRAFHGDATVAVEIINKLQQQEQQHIGNGLSKTSLPLPSTEAPSAVATLGTVPRQIVELGPGAGALTDKLVETYGSDALQCIEIDPRSIEILNEKHPDLFVHHADVLQIDYPLLSEEINRPLIVIGNLPYYITSQILFALADASHLGVIQSATVTMQWEVAQRMIAPTSTKDYGILSVVFQLYTTSCKVHFKIPPTVFYPQPKVDSALVGLQFCSVEQLHDRFVGVEPIDFRRVVTTAFQQRRKTLKKSLQKLTTKGQQRTRNNKIIVDNNFDDNKDNENNGDEDDNDEEDGGRSFCIPRELLDAEPLELPDRVKELQLQGDAFALKQELPLDWASRRPEELTPGQFIELTRLLYGTKHGVRARTEAGDTELTFSSSPPPTLGRKVWRKQKHGM